MRPRRGTVGVSRSVTEFEVCDSGPEPKTVPGQVSCIRKRRSPIMKVSDFLSSFLPIRKLSPLLPLFLLFSIIPTSGATQSIVKVFDTPGPEPRGLAWDGTYLWCADAQEDSIFKIDPVSGQVVHTLSFSRNFDFSRGGGITWSGDDALWATRSTYFYKIDATTGEEITNFHCPGG